jgi:hypothetical protein
MWQDKFLIDLKTLRYVQPHLCDILWLRNVSKTWRLDVIDRKILITCPVAGVAVATGFRAPAGTDITSLKRITLRYCSACAGEHVWDGEDGYWEKEAEPPAPSFWERFLNIWRGPKRP